VDLDPFSFDRFQLLGTKSESRVLRPPTAADKPAAATVRRWSAHWLSKPTRVYSEALETRSCSVCKPVRWLVVLRLGRDFVISANPTNEAG